MAGSRRNRGFERAGALPYDRLGLPKARAREMLLAQAWERVAGASLASRARAVRVLRGVLEIEVESGQWSDTLSDLLPRLAGRVSRDFPELGVRKCRCIRPGVSVREAASPLELEESPPAPAAAKVAPATERTPPSRPEAPPAEERLRELARRYLARSDGQNQ